MLDILLSYESLRVIWWCLLGVLLIGFAIMDGVDLGVATLLPFIAKTEEERKIALHTVAPYWEGNQVWLLLGGGAIFAAWPAVYAVSFSALYLILFLLLLAIILRPISFTFREKIQNKIWKRVWAYTHFVAGIVPAVLAGVAVGNVILGIPFSISAEDLSITYSGTFLALLNPYALLIGLISLVMLVTQGAIYSALKTEGNIAIRSAKIANKAVFLLLFLYVIASIVSMFFIEGYVLGSTMVHNAPSNPLHKVVLKQRGALYHNFIKLYWPILAPILVIGGIVFTSIFLKSKAFVKAFISNSVTILGIVATAGVTTFPFILPSSSDLISSLTVWDSSSSKLTLRLMLVVTIVFIPIIIFYTSWMFHVLRGKISIQDAQDIEY
ncbi:Cytochrome bd-I ubiquinol oxidase subunit 2 [Candidatus Hepatincola sp. Pdp]